MDSVPYRTGRAKGVRHGLAITALVVACVALVLVLGLTIFVGFAGLTAGFSSSTGGDLQGTAPRVVADQPYAGDLLAREVGRVITADGGDVTSMTCPDSPVVQADAVTVCHGVVDSVDSEVTVTFEDDLGHFTLVEQDNSTGG